MPTRGVREVLEQIGNGEMPVADFVRSVFDDGDRLVSLVQEAHSTPIGIDSPEVRNYVRAAAICLAEALTVNADEDVVIKWFHHEQLSLFDGATPARVIAQGNCDALVTYVQSLNAGWVG